MSKPLARRRLQSFVMSWSQRERDGDVSLLRRQQAGLLRMAATLRGEVPWKSDPAADASSQR
jgi:hypothetical protein